MWSEMPIFVIQEHDASRHHFDLRLQVGDKLKSWGIPDEPSTEPNVQREAVATEDSPLDYAYYQGVISEVEYGEGEVAMWDRGSYRNLRAEEMEQCIDDGRVEVWLEGERVSGGYALLRDTGQPDDGWTLVKLDDDEARSGRNMPSSIHTESSTTHTHMSERDDRDEERGETASGHVEPAGSIDRTEAKPEVGQLAFSNERKVLFPDGNITKRDLRRYYQRIADRLLPELAERPLLLRRFPDGIDGGGTFLRKIPDSFPRWIERIKLGRSGEEAAEYVICNDEATLLYLVDQACIEFHVWASLRDRPDHPDRMIFDLDPEDGRNRIVRAAARSLREVLDELELPSFVKTTGQRGLHIIVPLDRSETFEPVRMFAQEVGKIVASRTPDKFSVDGRTDGRAGRLSIDTARNGPGQTAIATYSVRARPGAPVAAPIEWRELYRRAPRSDQYHMRNIFRRLGQKDSAWLTMRDKATSLASAREKLPKVAASAPGGLHGHGSNGANGGGDTLA